ncbi:MAG: PEGA domain-containing protein [Magnetococcales bacterium]|nr:PEGA domain-containing protein [Magnetococcales bacterium]
MQAKIRIPLRSTLPTLPLLLPHPTAAAGLEGALWIRSVPRGAAVQVEGRPAGTTPLHLTRLAAGEWAVTASLPGYQPLTRRAAVLPGQSTPLVLVLAQLPPPGSITLVSDPPGAAWFLDGQAMEITPGRAGLVAPGPHHLEVRLAGYRPWEQRFTLDADQGADFLAPLERDPSHPVDPRRHRLELTTQPPQARVRFKYLERPFVNGMELPAGPYLLQVTAPGFQSRELPVTLGPEGWSGTVPLAPDPSASPE